MNPTTTPANTTNPVTMSPISNFQDLQNLSIQPPAQSAVSAAPVAAGKQPSFLARLAPTIGSILGGVGGEIVDPFGGGIAGAAIGGGLGKGVENASEGKNFLQTNDLGAAAEGGIGQGAGDLIGGAIGGIGGAVANKGNDALATQALKDAWGSVQGDITKSPQPFLNAVDVANKNGFDPSPENISQLGHAITGENGIYNNRLDDLVSKQGPVDMSPIANSVETTIQNNSVGNALSRANADGFRQQVFSKVFGNDKGMALAQTMKEIPGTDLTAAMKANGIDPNSLTQMSPEDALTFKRDMYNTANSAKTPAAARGLFGDVYNDARNVVYGQPGVNEAIAANPIKDEEMPDILNKVDGNQQMADAIRNGWNNASGFGDINSAQAQIIPSRELADKALTQNKVLETLPKGEQGQVENMIGSALTGDKGRMVENTLKKTVGNPQVYSKLGGVLGRMNPFTDTTGANLGLINKVPGAVGAGTLTLPNAATTGTGANMQPGMTGTAGTPGAVPQQPTDYNSLIQAMTALSVLDPTQASTATSLLGKALPGLQQSNVANQELAGTQNQFANAGGAQGVGGSGVLDSLLALIPGTAQHAARQQALQLTQSLGVSPGLAPNFLQTPGTAGNQITTLQSIANALGGGASPGGTMGVPGSPVQ